ncbi:unnamed protein product, partial [Penicillium discolor]
MHRVMQRGDEEHERGETLLPVDEDEVGVRTGAVLGGEDRTDEMAMRVVFRGHRPDIGEEPLAAADVPAVLPLVDRDDDGRASRREPFDRVDCRLLDVGRGAHAALEEKGFVVLDSYDQEADPKEWLDIEYVDWKSSGDTRFAPLASAFGDIECNGFWNHKPPRTDKDGVWIDEQTAKAPNLTRRAQEPGANVGRCR